MEDIIRLKGTGDGVKIFIEPGADISSVISALRQKLDDFRRFFGKGYCNIYIMGQTLEKSDILRVESVISSMLPESSVHYGEKKPVDETAEISEEKSELEEIKEVVTANFKSNRARFYEGVVRSGRTVESDGHLILMGNVEKGARLAAIGNIVVMGVLSGTAEAGCMGNNEAYVVAVEFEPEKIKIAAVTRREFDSGEKGMRKAVLTDNQIYTYEYLVK